MTKSQDKYTDSSLEGRLIKEAYAATLDPRRLADFEVFWENYIDAQLQNKPEGFDWENTPVNAHITMALDILSRVRTANDKIDIAQELVESHYGFGFIVDNEGRIIVANRDAKSFVGRCTHLNQGLIDALGLKNILAWLETTKTEFNFFEVFLYGGRKPDTWFISPIKLGRDSSQDQESYFLVASVDASLSQYATHLIGKHFGLTRAETQVAALLTDGQSPKEIAEIRNVRITAVRTQIAKIKDKMVARDIPDVVRKFLSMNHRATAVRSQIRRGEAIRGFRELSIRQSSMTLRDGRVYQYFEQGLSRGQPILQIHSLMGAVEYPQHISQELVRSGYRMISPSRAGFGKSEPNRKKSIDELMESTTRDLIELMDHLALEDVIVIAGMGGVFAQKLALKDDRVKKLVFTGYVPVWKQEYLQTFPPRYRNTLKTSIYAPKALPYLVRLGKALIDSGNKSVFLAGLHKQNSVDPKGLEGDQATKDAIDKLYTHLFGQGVDGFVDEVPTLHTDWTADARKLKIPITIVRGTKSQSQPLDAVNTYRKAAPQTKIVNIEGADAYQNATHFVDVLRAAYD